MRAEFFALFEETVTRLAPRDATQLRIARRIAALTWRQRRIGRAENQLITAWMDSHAASRELAWLESGTLAAARRYGIPTERALFRALQAYSWLTRPSALPVPPRIAADLAENRHDRFIDALVLLPFSPAEPGPEPLAAPETEKITDRTQQPRLRQEEGTARGGVDGGLALGEVGLASRRPHMIGGCHSARIVSK